MKKLNKKQKLIVLIAIVLITVIIAIVITTNIISNSGIANAKYSATTANASSDLVAGYIKKGITIGGVTGTLEDLDTSDATATAMDIAYGEVAYARGERIVGMYVNRGDVQVGDYVAYTPDTAESYSLLTTVTGYSSDQTMTQENLTWQVLSINDDGTIDLISSAPTSQSVGFGGALGYNNCVYLLNDICAELYSNENLGVTARSINLEDDIEPKMNETGIVARDSYRSGQTDAYGNVRTYTSSSYRYYPNLYAQERGSGIDTGVAREDGIGKNESYYSSPTEETYKQAVTSLTVTSDSYTFTSSNIPSYFDDTTWYDLVFNTSSYYWFASRCVDASPIDVYFRLRFVDINGNLNCTVLFRSSSGSLTRSYSFRPVVSLGSGVQIYGGDESAEHPYQLSA